MTNMEKIKYLQEAEKAFMEEPDKNLFNDLYLSDYFKHVWNLDINEVREIIKTSVLVLSQKEIYKRGFKDLYYERAKWCAKKIKRLIEKENLI